MMREMVALGLGLALVCCVTTAACAAYLGAGPDAGTRRRIGSAVMTSGAILGAGAVTAVMVGLVR
jgi:hypothetical protein